MHHLALPEMHRHQLAVYAAAHGDRGEGRDGTQTVQVDPDGGAATTGTARVVPGPPCGPSWVPAACGASPAAVSPPGDQKRYAPKASTTATSSMTTQRRRDAAGGGGPAGARSGGSWVMREQPFRCTPARAWRPAKTG